MSSELDRTHSFQFKRDPAAAAIKNVHFESTGEFISALKLFAAAHLKL